MARLFQSVLLLFCAPVLAVWYQCPLYNQFQQPILYNPFQQVFIWCSDNQEEAQQAALQYGHYLMSGFNYLREPVSGYPFHPATLPQFSCSPFSGQAAVTVNPGMTAQRRVYPAPARSTLPALYQSGQPSYQQTHATQSVRLRSDGNPAATSSHVNAQQMPTPVEDKLIKLGKRKRPRAETQTSQIVMECNLAGHLRLAYFLNPDQIHCNGYCKEFLKAGWCKHDKPPVQQCKFLHLDEKECKTRVICLSFICGECASPRCNHYHPSIEVARLLQKLMLQEKWFPIIRCKYQSVQGHDYTQCSYLHLYEK
ncbi:hypothetical protein [Spongorhabdus nitratireducens]